MRPDLSREPTSHVTEKALVYACRANGGIDGEEPERAEPCQCGTVIVTRPSEHSLQMVLDAHYATPKHLAWRAWRDVS